MKNNFFKKRAVDALKDNEDAKISFSESLKMSTALFTNGQRKIPRFSHKETEEMQTPKLT